MPLRVLLVTVVSTVVAPEPRRSQVVIEVIVRSPLPSRVPPVAVSPLTETSLLSDQSPPAWEMLSIVTAFPVVTVLLEISSVPWPETVGNAKLVPPLNRSVDPVPALYVPVVEPESPRLNQSV